MSDEIEKKDDDNLGSFYMGRTRIQPEEGSKRLLPQGALTFIVLLSFIGIIWYAYPRGEEKYENIDIPLVKADTSEIKEIPTEPSGMQVLHQDSTLFDSLGNKKTMTVENILPADEKPIDKENIVNKRNIINNAFKEAPRTVPVPAFKPIIKDVKRNLIVLKSKKKILKAKHLSLVKKDTYVQLGSYRENSDVQKDWIRIKKKYPKILSGLNMKIFRIDLKAKGIFFRLHAGKLSKDGAIKTCENIKALRGGCLVVKK